jgi:hypothetical protein
VELRSDGRDQGVLREARHYGEFSEGDPTVSTTRKGEAALTGGPFWRNVGKLAVELFNREVAHGKDYAITEVVHCKSRGNYGVDEALDTCSTKFLRRVLEYSQWKVLVVLGNHAEVAVKKTLMRSEARPVVYLAHPSARAANSGDLPAADLKEAELVKKPGQAKRVRQVKKAKTVKAAIAKNQISKESILQIRTMLNALSDQS